MYGTGTLFEEPNPTGYLKPRCDTHEGFDTEVTVTSSEELHKRAEEQRNRKEKRRLHPVGAQREAQSQKVVEWVFPSCINHSRSLSPG